MADGGRGGGPGCRAVRGLAPSLSRIGAGLESGPERRGAGLEQRRAESHRARSGLCDRRRVFIRRGLLSDCASGSCPGPCLGPRVVAWSVALSAWGGDLRCRSTIWHGPVHAAGSRRARHTPRTAGVRPRRLHSLAGLHPAASLSDCASGPRVMHDLCCLLQGDI